MSEPIMVQIFYRDSSKPADTVLLDIDSGITIFGREASGGSVDIKLRANDSSISREHLILKVNGQGKWEVESITSSSLTKLIYVKDQDLKNPPINLEKGDIFQLPTYTQKRYVWCDILLGSKGCKLSFTPQITLTEDLVSNSIDISNLNINGQPLLSSVSNISHSPKIIKFLFQNSPSYTPSEALGNHIDPLLENVDAKRQYAKKSIERLRKQLKKINDLGEEKVIIDSKRNSGYSITIEGKDV